MNNKEIAQKLNFLGKLLELHGESSFKTRSYTNAYLAIRKWPEALSEMPITTYGTIPGVGKAIQTKIQELLKTGEMQSLNEYLDLTPIGIQELLSIKGFGPKKVKLVWEELGIESIGELLYAINENRLVELKGFGAKTQEALQKQLQYHLESSGKFLFAHAEEMSKELIKTFKTKFPDKRINLAGEIVRKCDTVQTLCLVIEDLPEDALQQFAEENEQLSLVDGSYYYMNIALEVVISKGSNYYYLLAQASSEKDFWNEMAIPQADYGSEEEVFTKNNHPFYIPEYREQENLQYLKTYPGNQNIIASPAIKGCIHNHSTYSDGVNSLEEMLSSAADKGYEYFVITDHSKSAFYANGLQPERLQQQLDEVRSLDQANPDISFFSGIESDILSNGSLDYEDELLAELDVIVASVHSNLKMDQAKATKRLITAIEDRYTSILGHPTGRLLLSREGYPIDHKKVIDACADNGVAIELNANPNRLDMDWRWINYAISKEVLISINPDAHSITGIEDMYYGVSAARKAGLPISYCLNAMDIEEFEEWLADQHSKR